MDLVIKPAELCEADEIIRTANAAYSKYIARMGKKPAPMTEDYRSLIEGQADDETVYSAVFENRVMGFLVLKACAGYLLLDNVAIHPDFQRKGMGRRLFTFAEDLARERGFREIRLYTNEKMTENIGLYQIIGYAEYDRRREDGYDRVFFKKGLTGNAEERGGT